jgi:hypothetical protein
MPQQTLYDEIPYTSFPHSPSHPDQLATVTFLHGLDPPAVASCRVIELGCSAGANLLGMAYGLPGARLMDSTWPRARSRRQQRRGRSV